MGNNNQGNNQEIEMISHLERGFGPNTVDSTDNNQSTLNQNINHSAGVTTTKSTSITTQHSVNASSLLTLSEDTEESSEYIPKVVTESTRVKAGTIVFLRPPEDIGSAHRLHAWMHAR